MEPTVHHVFKGNGWVILTSVWSQQTTPWDLLPPFERVIGGSKTPSEKVAVRSLGPAIRSRSKRFTLVL